jgi:hypothetical protein
MTTLKLELPTPRQAALALPALVGFAAHSLFSGVWCWCADRLAPARPADRALAPAPTVLPAFAPAALAVQASATSRISAARSREQARSRAMTLR